MKSLRLKTIASFINLEDKVVDIGCDHAYLAIYLVENELCQKVIASDINQNALDNAKQNIIKANYQNQIKTYLSDGLTNILETDIDTLVIAGMGTSTILHIVKTAKNYPIKKLIIQSNNDLSNLRKQLRKQKYYLQKERVVYEHGHYYVINVFTKKHTPYSISEILFGKYDSLHKEYYVSLYNELEKINQKLSFKKNIWAKLKIFTKKILLKKYL